MEFAFIINNKFTNSFASKGFSFIKKIILIIIVKELFIINFNKLTNYLKLHLLNFNFNINFISSSFNSSAIKGKTQSLNKHSQLFNLNN
jgi:hypothetical protein